MPHLCHIILAHMLSSFLHSRYKHTPHKRFWSFWTNFISHCLTFFSHSCFSKKSHSSFRRPTRPRSERLTDWLHELWGRRRRSPSRPGSCDRLQRSPAWQSSQTSGPWRTCRDPQRSGSDMSKNNEWCKRGIITSATHSVSLTCKRKYVWSWLCQMHREFYQQEESLSQIEMTSGYMCNVFTIM